MFHVCFHCFNKNPKCQLCAGNWKTSPSDLIKAMGNHVASTALVVGDPSSFQSRQSDRGWDFESKVVIERDKRAVLIANNFFKSQLFFNKSYALRSVGTSEGVTCCAGSWRKSGGLCRYNTAPTCRSKRRQRAHVAAL